MTESIFRIKYKELVCKNKCILGDSIELRLESVKFRKELGCWEANTVVDSKYENESSTVTLVERNACKAI